MGGKIIQRGLAAVTAALLLHPYNLEARVDSSMSLPSAIQQPHIMENNFCNEYSSFNDLYLAAQILANGSDNFTSRKVPTNSMLIPGVSYSMLNLLPTGDHYFFEDAPRSGFGITPLGRVYVLSPHGRSLFRRTPIRMRADAICSFVAEELKKQNYGN